MKCACGTRTLVQDTRGNDYCVYRLHECPSCKQKFITKEMKIDYKEGRRMMNKIHTVKYRELKAKIYRRRRRRE